MFVTRCQPYLRPCFHFCIWVNSAIRVKICIRLCWELNVNVATSGFQVSPSYLTSLWMFRREDKTYGIQNLLVWQKNFAIPRNQTFLSVVPPQPCQTKSIAPQARFHLVSFYWAAISPADVAKLFTPQESEWKNSTTGNRWDIIFMTLYFVCNCIF